MTDDERERRGDELDARLDTFTSEAEVRRVLEDFGTRVVAARYRAPEGPPLVTVPRDVDAEVEAWRQRRTTRLAAQRAASGAAPTSSTRRWWQRAR
ncbi:MAG: hypothetical protein LH468_12320 [Nocardioides sp.]|nr:hypothetical protein [Nocardioides sp.]